MNKILPSDLLYSKENMDLLSLLQSGSKEKETLLKEMRASSQKLSPQLTELTDSKIITFQDNKYALSTMGKLLVSEVTSVLDTIRFFDDNYWWNHNFDFIPSPLLRRFCRIKDWVVLEPNTSEMYDYNREVYDDLILSDSINTVVTSPHPFSFKVSLEVLDNKANLSAVFDPALADKVRIDTNEKIQKLLNYKQYKLYVYPHSINLVSFLVTDSYLLLRPLTNDGTYDGTQIIGNSQEAVELGRELFDYYAQRSKPITKIKAR